MEPDIVSVVIKSGGSWTSKLHKHLSSSLDHLQVSVEGPYGPASTHFLRWLPTTKKYSLELVELRKTLVIEIVRLVRVEY